MLVHVCVHVCACVLQVGSMADNPRMCESYEVGVAANALSVKSHRVLQSCVCVCGANDVVETLCYMLWIAMDERADLRVK